uniref:Variant surface glycoprotein 1125.480 n=1 Tax=Trypanosoma brucei TaxID=5691 RepID=A0A1J0R5Y8_9TRYP|nr:variant surface glycoprotein 1125.480 [Trypanosoma brucei]
MQLQVFVLVAALTIWQPRQTLSSEFHETDLQTKDGCDSAANFDKMANALHSKLTKQTEQTAAGKADLLRLLATAATKTKNEAIPMLAIAGGAAVRLAKAARDLETARTAIEPVIGRLRQLQGTAYLLEDLAAAKVKPKTTSLAANFASGNGLIIEFATLTTAEQICFPASPQPRSKGQNIQPGPTGFSIHVPIIKKASPNAGTKTEGPRICSSGAAVPADCSDATGAGTNFALSTGPMLKTELTSWTQKQPNADDFTEMAGTAKDILPHKSYIQNMLKGVGKAISEATKLTFNSNELRGFNVVSDPVVGFLLLKSTNPTATWQDVTSKADTVDYLRTKAYGGEAAKYKEKIWDLVDATSISQQAINSDSATDLKDISDIGKLITAFSFYSIQANSKEVTSQKENSKHHNADCDGQEENKCKGKCEWNKKDGKCEAKGGEDGVKAEERKEEKCAGKLDDACKKSTECKWDGKECKDSSALINKKFTLSMVTAIVSLVPF